MIVSIIVAVSKNWIIGKYGEIPWKLPADMRYFKSKTVGNPVIMGRKTYESILRRLGGPLPDRFNIVLTRSPGDIAKRDVVTVNSPEAALGAAKLAAEEMGSNEIFVIGGSFAYEAFLPIANRIYLTLVDANFDGDVRFPRIDDNEWMEVSRDTHSPDEKNKYGYSFVVLERR